MSIDNTIRPGPRSTETSDIVPFHDALNVRLRWAVLISLIVNIFLWDAASGIARRQKYHNLKPIEVERVIIDPKTNRKIVKVVKKQDIQKKVAHVQQKIQQRRPEWRPRQVSRPQPKPQHNRVLTARGPASSSPNDHTALEGGTAQVGKAIEQQQPEPPKQVEAPPPPKPEPPKAEAPPPPKPEPPKAEAPPPPKPEPPKAEAPPPPKPEPPKPVGPTKDADYEDAVKPEIPDDLKNGSYKSFVRVKVEIDADGSFTPILRTSSGNEEIDKRVLEALKKWKWKPALKDGVPIKSTRLFKFEFLVE